jgi:D-glycero-alpha-D-manno-heptose-7-phosphate kinase
MLICRTPFRVSLFGGGTDFPEWFEKYHDGITFSFSIDKYCYTHIRELPKLFPFNYRLRYFKDEAVNKISEIKHPTIKLVLKKMFKKKNLELFYTSDIPGMSGLGSSSAFTVSLIKLINTLNEKNLTKSELATQAVELERKGLKEIVGFQDQYACAFGGFNKIIYSKNGVKVSKVNFPKKKIKELISNCLLVYSGLQRKSQSIEKDKIKNIKKNYSYFLEMLKITKEAEKIFKKNISETSLKEISNLLKDSWEIKKKFSSLVTNHEVDSLYKFGLKNGACAGKLLGAGGGGFVLFLTENLYNQKKLIKKLKNKIFFKVNLDEDGSKIIYQDNKF